MAHFMLDLETLSTASNAAIIAIGAVEFDPITERRVLDRFTINVNAKSCIDAGLHLDPDTIMWWMKQSEAARKQFELPNVPLYDALRHFTNFMGDGQHTVWGNGATFDNVILSNAYKALKLKQPWPYWNDRCYRTIKEMYPQITIDRSAGVHHNALHDAENQALHLIKLWPMLNQRFN